MKDTPCNPSTPTLFRGPPPWPSRVQATVMEGLQDQCVRLIEQVLAPQSGLQAFNLLANSILAEIDQQLAQNLPGRGLQG